MHFAQRFQRLDEVQQQESAIDEIERSRGQTRIGGAGLDKLHRGKRRSRQATPGLRELVGAQIDPDDFPGGPNQQREVSRHGSNPATQIGYAHARFQTGPQEQVQGARAINLV
jgi:hypothetical protein